LKSEVTSREIVQNITSVPFASPDVEWTNKTAIFSQAVGQLQDVLKVEGNYFTMGFLLLMVMLVRMVKATDVHPRTGLLTGTIAHGLGDLYHFAILFLLVFLLNSLVAHWAFGGTFKEFKDVRTAMKNQLQILLGNLPADFDQHFLMIVYVTSTAILMFFLMLNFLLAIVVEAYTKVRQDIESIEVENEIVTDISLTFKHRFQRTWYRWTSTQQMLSVLQRNVATRSVNAEHLRLSGISVPEARQFLNVYGSLQCLGSKESKDVYERAIEKYKAKTPPTQDVVQDIQS